VDSDDICWLSAVELGQAFAAGTLSPVDALEAVYSRLEHYKSALNAFVAVDGDRARAVARESATRWRAGKSLGPLDGLPFSVKDTLMIAGYPMRRGSRTTSDKPVVQSSPCVDRLLEAGAVPIGTTTTPEFGVGPVTISPLTGITFNPWNRSRGSGGSSGGAAASIAAGIGVIALATDSGGSIRVPAALCGAVGYKATGGCIPVYPASPAGALAVPCPIVRHAADLPAVMAAIAKPDPRDAEGFAPANPVYAHAAAWRPQGKRIALSITLGYATRVDPDIERAVRAAAATFAALGATVEEADPGLSDPIDIFTTMFHSSFAHALRDADAAQMAQFDPTLRAAIEAGRKLDVPSVMQANDLRRALAEKLQKFHSQFDLLLTPMVAVPAFLAELRGPTNFADAAHMRAWTPFGYPFNLSQQPAISVPCGLTAEGLPIGLQIVGPRFADADVIGAAMAYEMARGEFRAPV
jgi:aspartyl-tRNA(Asn)/glutamyl-tRNA(Gln) amidotransferase subunit A